MSTTRRVTAGSVAAAFLLSFLVFVPPAFGAESTPAIDPRAREVLKAMGAYIKGLQTFEIRGDSTEDVRLENGMLVERAHRTTTLVRRPDRMRATVVGDARHNYLYLRDGKLTLYTHDGGYYSEADAPKSIAEAMEFALEEFALEAPLLDLLFEDASTRFVDGVESAIYLGETQVRGVDCHQIALRDPEVDVQVWVAKGDQPVLKKITIAYRWVTGSPQFSSILDWDPSPRADDGLFVFKPPKDAMKIEFKRTGE